MEQLRVGLVEEVKLLGDLGLWVGVGVCRTDYMSVYLFFFLNWFLCVWTVSPRYVDPVTYPSLPPSTHTHL